MLAELKSYTFFTLAVPIHISQQFDAGANLKREWVSPSIASSPEVF
jgi:hypothetical protein